MRGLLARSGMTMMLLLTLSAGCARQPRALYTTYALGGGWCEATPTPIHAATDTAPGAPRFTLRGEVRTPPNGPALSNTRVLLYGHGAAAIHGQMFAFDSVPGGRYSLVALADGYMPGVKSVHLPTPPDSSVVVSLTPLHPGQYCLGGFHAEVRPYPSSRPWWQFWRRRE